MAAINYERVRAIALDTHFRTKTFYSTNTSTVEYCHCCGKVTEQYRVYSYDLEIYYHCLECDVRIVNTSKFRTVTQKGKSIIGPTTQHHIKHVWWAMQGHKYTTVTTQDDVASFTNLSRLTDENVHAQHTKRFGVYQENTLLAETNDKTEALDVFLAHDLDDTVTEIWEGASILIDNATGI